MRPMLVCEVKLVYPLHVDMQAPRMQFYKQQRHQVLLPSQLENQNKLHHENSDSHLAPKSPLVFREWLTHFQQLWDNSHS
ncbi:hypothetical protein CHS0354_012008 [Potamilus streckersoni]|uniref:Uncharacterized protein n=1 Tax=Potamilus streckersoni TaxID=2493646 RepID=A0AAE0VTU7_9BIVA|nr:hypothetical protein CHS0354_012008 [Potamilus streckersoni]